MQRITQKDLEAVVNRINLTTNSPAVTWQREKVNGRLITKSNVGNYHLSYAYGGVCLHRIDNESGGVNCPINSSYVTKRELYTMMQAYIRGLGDK